VRVLVTGAAGFLGRALVRLLAARGDDVMALVRSPAPALEALGARVVRGDVTDPASLRAAVEGQELVFHLAGVRRATDPAEFLRVNAGSTRDLLEACTAVAPGLARFVLAGSMAAAGPSATPRLESDPAAPVEPYGASKVEAERIALSYADRIPVAVARPPRILGPGDRENLFFFRIARAGLAIGFTGGVRPLSWIDVDDCARGLLLLADRPEARGEAFFLASPEVTDAQAIQLLVADSLGVKARRVTVPGLLVRAVAEAGEAVRALTGRRLPLNRKLAAQVLASGWVCDPSKARQRLGFVAGTSLAESVRRSVEWYRREGLL
jgi:nucleoside-diphosphate-sugar epimerase